MLHALWTIQIILTIVMIVGVLKPRWVIRWGKRRGRGMVLIYYLIPCAILVYVTLDISKSETFHYYQKANQYWNTGNTDDSIKMYRELLDTRKVYFLSNNNKTLVCSRVVDFEIKSGDIEKAKKTIRDSIKYNIELKLETEKGRELYNKVK